MKKLGRPKGMPRTPAELAADAKRTGRPPVEEGKARKLQLCVRVTEEERRILDREATRQGVSITDLLLGPYRDDEPKPTRKRKGSK